MSPAERRTELALRKQRLLLQSAMLRADFAQYARPLTPLFGAVDRVRTGIHWLKQHPALPVLIATALLVARPRAALRWVQRGWFAWQAINQLRGTRKEHKASTASKGLQLAALAQRWFRR